MKLSTSRARSYILQTQNEQKRFETSTVTGDYTASVIKPMNEWQNIQYYSEKCDVCLALRYLSCNATYVKFLSAGCEFLSDNRNLQRQQNRCSANVDRFYLVYVKDSKRSLQTTDTSTTVELLCALVNALTNDSGDIWTAEAGSEHLSPITIFPMQWTNDREN